MKKTRRVVGLLFIVSITLLFLDFTGSVHAWLGWMAKIQFLPAVLAMNVGVVVALLLLTLVLGRVYCSVICPLGVFQDLVSWGAGRRKKNRFSYSPALTWLRYGVLAVFVLLMVLGMGSVAALIAPYSAYGRMVNNLLQPIYIWCNNLLAMGAEHFGSYAFYSAEVWFKGLPMLIVALVTLVVIVVLAWRGGRTWCNTICPVGTVLGFVSQWSLLRPVIDTSKCNGCTKCARNCKASCINAKEHKIDYSRCVACFDCIDNCKQGAISYRVAWKKNEVTKPQATPTETPVDETRRNFLSATALLGVALAAKAQEKTVDGGLADIIDKKPIRRETPITPPGSLSARNFAQHCTACQLCVSACPNGVLRPSTDLERFMQPEASYERGYCRPECTKCSEVCPAGAIRPITVADKSAIQVGHAVWIKENCVALKDHVNCSNCARHCPTGAIEMIPSDPNDEKSRKIPAINTERCIGCGACENLCPARPFSAIYVEGHQQHRVI